MNVVTDKFIIRTFWLFITVFYVIWDAALLTLKYSLIYVIWGAQATANYLLIVLVFTSNKMCIVESLVQPTNWVIAVQQAIE